MASFSQLISDVYTITTRPDLVEETKLAIKQATLKAHHSDFYPKDIYENGLSFSTSEYFQTLDYRMLVPRWRAFKYLRKFDAVAVSPGAELTIITPDQIFDEYMGTKTDVCYQAGANININSSTKEQYYLFGCYIHPDITDAGYSSWIALDNPYAIEFEAARVLFKMIGYDEQSSMYEKLVLEQFAELKMNNLLANGY